MGIDVVSHCQGLSHLTGLSFLHSGITECRKLKSMSLEWSPVVDVHTELHV